MAWANTHIINWGYLLVAILTPKKVRFELRDPDLRYAWDICNI
jgi:hypothetical protein